MVEDIAVGAGRTLDDAHNKLATPETPAAGAGAAWAPRSLALAAAAALAACGGGGGDAGGSAVGAGGANGSTSGAGAASAAPDPLSQAGSLTPVGSTATAATYQYREASSDAEAARFLLQAQGAASEAQIAAVRSQGYLPWLGAQMDAAPAQTGWDWLDSKPYNSVSFDDMAWRQLIAAPDPLRQRLALALSEIFVVSGTDIGSNWPHHMMAQYWDTLVAGVTGNFRTLLEAVTLNPAMGYYLNTRGNQKEDSKGRQPDENYGREVMQLMTIGLAQLEADGSVRRGADGAPLDSYSQDDVTNIARVFTGYDRDIAAGENGAFTAPGASSAIETNGWTRRPMALTASRHSTLEARFLGAVVPAGTDGKAALKIALDTLFNHPNVGPFIGRQLIQRLVTSNPSPAYVARVAAVFADNGAGVRGDLKSVFAAVLLDNEARSPDGLAAPTFGRLREPMLRLVQWARTFDMRSAADTWKIGNTSDSATRLGQSPLRSPSVFNFFRPGYVPPSTAIATGGMVAPEFQLVNETSVGGYLNYMQTAIEKGVNANKDLQAAYTAEKALVLDAAALVDRLNLLLCANQLSRATTELIKDALAKTALTTTSNEASRNNRVYAAVLLVMGCPEYLVQK